MAAGQTVADMFAQPQAASGSPAPPPGFQLEDDATPPPPPGFQLESAPPSRGFFSPAVDTFKGVVQGFKDDYAHTKDEIARNAHGPDFKGDTAAFINSFVHPLSPGGVLRGSEIPAAVMSPVSAATNIVAEPFDKATGLDLNKALMALGPAAGVAGDAEVLSKLAKPAGPLSKAIAPFAAALSPEVASQEAARVLATRATSPKTVAAMLEQPGEIVPGSQPTTFQQTGDMGLGALEREVATKNPEQFNTRRAEQNQARVQQLSELQQGADPNDVAKSLKAQFDDLDAATQAKVDAATAAAQAKAAEIGTGVAPEESGNQLREVVTQAEDAAKAQERGLWAAVDPNGDMTGNVAQTTAEAKAILGEASPTAKPMEGEEAAIFQVAADLPALSPVSHLIDLRSRVSAALRAELIANGKTPAYARLSRLRGAIQDNLANTISHAIETEGKAVSSGSLGQQDTILARLREWQQRWGEGGADAGAGAVRNAGGPETSVSGVGGAGREARGGLDNAARDQGVSENARADVSASRAGLTGDLFSAIRKLGGLKIADEAGNALGGADVGAALTDVSRQPGLINNKTGRSPEYMAQALDDRGWFGHGVEDVTGAFEAALMRQGRGQRVFHPEQYESGHAENMRRVDQELVDAGVTPFDKPVVAAQKLAAYRNALGDIRRQAESMGINPDRHLSDVVSDIAEREAIQAENPDPAPSDPHGEEFDRLVRGGKTETPTFDAGAADRLKAATAATKERAGTFNQGPVGQVTRRAGSNDSFRLPDGSVAKKFFHPGPTGYSDMQALFKAVGEDKALPVIEDYAATSLRRQAMNEDGTLDPVKFQRWLKQHADSLRALPEQTVNRFANAAEATKAVQESMAGRTQALKDAQAGAVGKVMGLGSAEEVTNAVGRILTSPKPVEGIVELLKATAGDPAAREGLRQAVADFITRKLIGNTEAGTSGVDLIKSDQFQTFIKNARPALKLVLKPEQFESLEAVAEDLHRSARSQNAVKLPGGSNTAQDAYALAKGEAPKQSLLWLAVKTVAGAAGTAAHGFGAGLAGIFGVQLVQQMRAAGITRISDLVTKAMLEPEVAKALLAKVPAKPPSPALKRVARAINVAQIASFASLSDTAQKKEPAQ